MPTVERPDATLYYEATSDPADEAVVFVPEAGLGAWSWGWQHRAVAGPHDAVVYDARGTGRSEAAPGDWDADALAADLGAVCRDAGVRRAHLVGLGVGALVALQYALTRDRVASLTLIGAAADGASIDRGALATLLGDPETLAPGLSSEFVADQPDVAARIREWRAAEDAPPAIWRAQADAVADFDAGGRLHEVTAPALVCHGDGDRIVPPSDGRALAEGLPRGEWHAFAGAGHLVTIERSRPLNDALLAHLDGGES